MPIRLNPKRDAPRDNHGVPGDGSTPDHRVLSGSREHATGADADAAIAYALARLATELSPLLTYHNLFHTRDDVLPAVRRLAAISGVAPEDTALLAVAAAFHDIGFVVRREEHERASAEIAGSILPGFGFLPDEVADIQGMILATRLPQSPQTPLEELLADADLDVLGRADWLPRAEALRAELSAFGQRDGDADWLAGQIAFMREHRYFTAAARTMRDAGKQAAIADMVAMAEAAAGEANAPAR